MVNNQAKYDFSEKASRKYFIRCVQLTAISVLLYSCYFWILRHWTIDDAGISYAYASNLVRYGQLTAQIGVPPVEGYSNLLWVLMLSLFTWLSDPENTIKYTSYVISIVFFGRLGLGFPGVLKIYGALAAVLIALQPACSIWFSSGLENPLTALLIVELIIAWLLLQKSPLQLRNMLVLGIILGLIAVNRPEGLAYLVAVPIGLCLSKSTRHFRPVALVGAVSLLIFLSFIAMRLIYFGDWRPNTYYVKAHENSVYSIGALFTDPYFREQIYGAFTSIYGQALLWPCLLASLIIIYMALIREYQTTLPFFYLALVSLLCFLILPQDWMGEFRYLTSFYIAFYCLIVFATFQFEPVYRNLLIVVLLSVGLMNTVQRLPSFLSSLPMPMNIVSERGEIFKELGEIVGLSRPVVLTADVGGLLIHDKLNVVDLGLLTDRIGAKLVGDYLSEPRKEEYLDYVFSQRKPDFIHIRAYQSWRSGIFDSDAFKSEFVPLIRSKDKWVEQRYGVRIETGLYIRSSLLEGETSYMVTLQNHLRQGSSTIF